ncbi:hypothetical protein ACLOJK_014003 [Asimina triloba]
MPSPLPLSLYRFFTRRGDKEKLNHRFGTFISSPGQYLPSRRRHSLIENRNVGKMCLTVWTL